MLVRLETIKNTDTVLVVDENNKYIGKMEPVEFFLRCILEDREPIEEDGYTYFFVDKECLNNQLNK